MPKKIKNKNEFEKAIITWKAPEYPLHEKSVKWMVGFWGITALLAAYGVVSGSFTFAIAIVVFAGTYFLLHKEKPEEVTVKISDMGVKIGRHMFPYSHLKNFWIVYEPPLVNKLYLRMASRLKPDIFVLLEDMDAAKVRETLKTHVAELSGHHEPFSDALVRLLRL